jgi:hypothetical protein
MRKLLLIALSAVAGAFSISGCDNGDSPKGNGGFLSSSDLSLWPQVSDDRSQITWHLHFSDDDATVRSYRLCWRGTCKTQEVHHGFLDSDDAKIVMAASDVVAGGRYEATVDVDIKHDEDQHLKFEGKLRAGKPSTEFSL